MKTNPLYKVPAYFLLILLGLVFLLPEFVSASNLTSFSDNLSSYGVAQPADHAFMFVTPTGVSNSSGSFDVFFDNAGKNFDLTSLTVHDISLQVDDNALCDGPWGTKNLFRIPFNNTWGVDIDTTNDVIHFVPPTNVTPTEIPAGRCVRIRMGQNVPGGAGQIVNPAVSASYVVKVNGAFGDYGGMALLILNDNGVSVGAIVDATSIPPDATTTPPDPGGGGGGGSGGGGGNPPVVTDTTPPTVVEFEIDDIKKDSAKIKWKTDEQVICSLRYGKTTNYELSTVMTGSYSRECEFELKNLKVDTRYYFEAMSVDQSGNQTATLSSFRTALNTKPSGLPDVPATENVANLRLTPQNNQVRLEWQYSGKNPVKYFLILRSENFFPTNENDGNVVYLGFPKLDSSSKYTFTDDRGLKPGAKYYYTVISITPDGHRSSGAVNLTSVPQRNEAIPLPVVVDKNIPSASSRVKTPVGALINLKISDIDFLINGAKIDIYNPLDIEIYEHDLVTIMVAKAKLLNKVRKILVNVEGKPNDQIITLDNRVENKFFVGNIGPFAPGNYNISIGLYDKNNELIKVVKGRLVSRYSLNSGAISDVIKVIKEDNDNNNVYILAVTALSAVLVFSVVMRRRRAFALKNKKEAEESKEDN